ncbi:hypothetical protein JCM3774_001631 [Rhodotorula dairenensis]
MLYAAQAQGPTAQLAAIQARLFSPTRSALVVNKLDRIECSEFDQHTSTLSLVCTVPVHGQVAAIESVHLPGHETATLVVLTTSLRLFCLARANASAADPYTLETVASISIDEPFGRLADYQAILVDPQTRCIAVHAYAGLLRVVSLVELHDTATSTRTHRRGSRSTRGAEQPGADDSEPDEAVPRAPAATATYRTGPVNLDHNFTVRLSSLLNVVCLAFVGGALGSDGAPDHHHGDPAVGDTAVVHDLAPLLACIHTDHTGSRVLTSLQVDLADKDVRTGPLEPQTLTDQGSEVIIPVRPDGLLIVGESTVTSVRIPALFTATAAQSGAAPTPGKGKRRASSSAGQIPPSPKPPTLGLSRPLPIARIMAWVTMTDNEFLLGDIYGKLLLVTLHRNSSSNSNGAITDLSVADLGDATSPTALVALGDGGASTTRQSWLFYVASRFGDSQLVRLDRTGSPAAAGNDLQLVASYPSLAPILDFCLLEDEAGGSSCLVTCSGAYKTGSLRVVRRGVGLAELAALDLPEVQRLWSIAEPSGSTLLVLGSYADTRTLRVVATSPDTSAEQPAGLDRDLDIEEVAVFPFADPVAAASTTVFAGAVGENLLVQVRSDGVAYSSPQATSACHWAPTSGRKVTAAETGTAPDGTGFLLVAVEGGELVAARAQGAELVAHGTHNFDHDIASVTVGRIGERTVAAVGLWTCQEVHLVAVPSFEPLATLSVDSTYLIISLAIDEAASTKVQGATARASCTLFVGLGDGSLLTYDVDSETIAVRSRSTKPTPLGTRPLTFANLGGQGHGVLAMSERPTIVTSGARLTYSSVNLTDAVAATSFRPDVGGASSSPPLLAVATSEGVVVGQLDTVQQIDVRTVPLDEDEPRRIAHDPRRRIFGVVCSKRDVDRRTGSQFVTSSVRFVRQEDYETTATHVLNDGEEAHSIACVTSGESSFFVVGTASRDASTTEPQHGRLLVLQENADGDILVASETPIEGCPYAIVAFGENLVATAVNSQVAVWSVSPEGELTLSATWSGAFIAYTLARGSAPLTLIVGDALRSVTLLSYVPPATAPMQAQLKELGKDYRARYMVAVEALSSDGGDGKVERIVGADADLNLFTLERDAQVAARSLADAGVLAAQGQWHVGQVVSRFRRGALTRQHDASGGANGISSTTYVQPQLVYTTSAGSIGVIAEIDAESGRVLSALERNLRGVIASVGDLDQETFRSYKSDKVVSSAAGFVDGTFVERFLDLGEAEQERVLAGRSEPEKLDVTREDVIALLEEMARTH